MKGIPLQRPSTKKMEIDFKAYSSQQDPHLGSASDSDDLLLVSGASGQATDHLLSLSQKDEELRGQTLDSNGIPADDLLAMQKFLSSNNNA